MPPPCGLFVPSCEEPEPVSLGAGLDGETEGLIAPAQLLETQPMLVESCAALRMRQPSSKPKVVTYAVRRTPTEPELEPGRNRASSVVGNTRRQGASSSS